MTHCHDALRPEVLEEPAEQLHGVEGGGAEACAAHFPGGEGDRAVRERNDAAVGDGDLEDRGGAGGEGRVAVGGGLAVAVPVGVPDQWGDLCQQSILVHSFFAERAGNG